MPSRRRTRVVGEHDAERHATGISARIAGPDSSSFGMNPRTRLASRRGPYDAGFAARGQDDERRRPVDRELAGDLEALDVGQADIEEDEVRAEGSGGLEAGEAVGRLADDVEAVGGEEGAGLDAEARAVIDDEDGVHGLDRGRPVGPLLQG